MICVSSHSSDVITPSDGFQRRAFRSLQGNKATDLFVLMEVIIIRAGSRNKESRCKVYLPNIQCKAL
jgi:hypothetical protein